MPNVSNSIRNNSPLADDYYYCQPNSSNPWNSVQEAFDGMPQAYRGLGKKFLVLVGGIQQEYWFAGGTEIQNLVPVKQSLGVLPKASRAGLSASTTTTAYMLEITDVGEKNLAVYDQYDTFSSPSTFVIVDGNQRRYKLEDPLSVLAKIVEKIGIYPEL